MTQEEIRIEPKGLNSYRADHCGHYWFFTNNENSLRIENSDRRFTLHKCDDTIRGNTKHFNTLGEEINNKKIQKSAFEYFASRNLSGKNMRQAFDTKFKSDQKLLNLPIAENFLIEKCVQLKGYCGSMELYNHYKSYCEENCHRPNSKKIFQQQLNKLRSDNLVCKIRRIDGKTVRRYIIDPEDIEKLMRKRLSNPDFNIKDYVDEIEAYVSEEE
jgi:hypothetical protein